MDDPQTEKEVLDWLVKWGENQPLVRAMLLTSSRAVPQAPVDLLSDYDVILVLRDIHPFHEDRDWLETFGHVLALYRDPIITEDGLERSGNVTQYEDGLKIDFSLWPIALIQKIVAALQLPDEFDAGYQILLDKDGLTAGLKPPTYQAYIPKPPSLSEYLDTVEVFFVDAAYVAKFLWRDDLIAAKEILDHFIKQEHLLPMLEWRSEIDRQWTVRPGLYGRRLKILLRPDLWAELENTYAGPGLEANWEALFRTIDLIRKAAIEVGERLGYSYPHELDRRATAYLLKVKNLDRNAKRFQ